MKKIYLLLGLLICTVTSYSQIKYDDGPIITSNNFVTEGTWGRSNITFSFQNGTNDISNDDERNAIRQAFQLWADYANLNFTEIATNGDIIISWQMGNHGDGYPFDGLNGVLAHAFFPPPDGGTFSGDVHFDDDETWSMNMQASSAQPIDLVTVAAHEIGHALGLGHSTVACALMNAFYTGSHRYLSKDDIEGIRSIYGNRSPISSSNLDCSGGNLFINNLHSGATVFWESANTSIASVANNNNHGLVERVGNANGTVRITTTITLPCGNTVTESLDVVIGSPPEFDNISCVLNCPSGFPSSNYCTNTNYIFFASPSENSTYWASQNLTYYWSYTDVSTGQFTTVGTFYGSFVNIQPQIHFPQAGEYNIQVVAQNQCGTSSVAQYGVTVVDCYGGWGIKVSPNPSTSFIDVTLIEPDVAKSQKMGIHEIQIIDKMGHIVKQFKYNGRTRRITLNISGLKTNLYYIRIFNGKEWKSQLFIKQ